MKTLRNTLLASLLLISATVSAKERLLELESKLWNYIVKSQVKSHKVGRHIGGWPTYSKIKGSPFLKAHETNSFLPLQLLVAAKRVSEKYELPKLEEVEALANKKFGLYRADTVQTNEPEGTISYWPIRYTKSGEIKRTFSVRFPYRNMSFLNLPNDFDSSSQAFMWFFLSDQHHDYFASFAKSVGEHLDEGRSVVHKNDKRWKDWGSGAFLTWAEPDLADSSKSRVYGGINDVDCVVNLNVLTALGTYLENFGELPKATERGMQQSCKIINKAIYQGTTGKCAVWYDRKSQFYTAYAKAQDANVSCLEETRELAKKRVRIETRKVLKKLGKGKYVEIAEYITAIKKMWPKSERDEELNYYLYKMTKLLKAGIKVDGDVAYLKSKDSLFTGKVKGMRFNWFSRPFSAVLALEALTLE